jgi:hypothetical protein
MVVATAANRFPEITTSFWFSAGTPPIPSSALECRSPFIPDHVVDRFCRVLAVRDLAAPYNASPNPHGRLLDSDSYPLQ